MNKVVEKGCAALMAATLLPVGVLGLAACGGSNRAPARAAFHDKALHPYVPPAVDPAPARQPVDRDHDSDIGNTDFDPNPNGLEIEGAPAAPADRAAIAALARRYYAAAAAADGARACALLYSLLAEAAAENFGTTGGPPYDHGVTTCAAAVSGVFHHYHAQLAAEIGSLRVLRVLVKERQAAALLSFGSLPRRELLFKREGRVWRVAAVLGRELR